MVTIKGALGILPTSICRATLATIDETTALLSQMERALELDGKLPADPRDTIRKYNQKYSPIQAIRSFLSHVPWADDGSTILLYLQA